MATSAPNTTEDPANADISVDETGRTSVPRIRGFESIPDGASR